MSVRATRRVSRFVEGAMDAVHDRAPALSERVYRTVAAPLVRADPAGAASSVEARLDGTRIRVAEMAAKGAVPAAGARRVRRDLARTRTDVEYIAPRLPAVQARCLVERSNAYNDVLQTLTHEPITRKDQAWGTAVLAGATAAWIGLLLLLTGVVAAVLTGLIAGGATASVIGRARSRRVGRVRLGALAEALARADAVAAGSPAGAAAAARVEVPRLDRDRRALLDRARASGRLDDRGLSALQAIDGHLDDLLMRLVEDELEADGAHLVRATVERYLPDTLEPFLAMSDAQALVRERPAAVEVADQLGSIQAALADLVRRPSRINPEQQLLRQGEFLRSKFGASDR